MSETGGTVTWIEETAKAVDLARNAEEAQKQARLLGDSQADLQRTLSRFRSLDASAVVLRGLNWQGRTPSPDLSRDLDSAAETLDERPLTRIPRALDQFERDVAASLIQYWNEYAAERLGDFTDLLELSRTLSGVEGIAEVSQQLSVILGNLARSQASLPSSASVNDLATAERLRQQLESSLKPSEVRRFLSAVARGGASVSTLTPDVKQWLNDHGALDSFRIAAGPPVGDSDD